MVMRLRKSCKPEHNIKSNQSAKLKLGTFEEYRNTEDTEIQDKGEASNTLTVEIEGPVKMSAEIFNALTANQFNVGGDLYPPSHELPPFRHVRAESIQINYDGNPIELGHARLLVDRQLPNGFIFCMSMVDDNDPENIFSEYRDSWSIPIEKSHDFAKLIAKQLSKHFEQDWVTPKITKKYKEIRYEYGPVTYADRNFVINSAKEKEIVDTFHRVQNIAFTKPATYSKEKEFRFLFEVLSFSNPEDKIAQVHSPACQSIYIDLEIAWDKFS